MIKIPAAVTSNTHSKVPKTITDCAPREAACAFLRALRQQSALLVVHLIEYPPQVVHVPLALSSADES